MKKLIALLLVLAMILSFTTVFTACDDSGYSAEDDDDDDDDDDDHDGNEKDPVVTPLTDEEAAKKALLETIDMVYNGNGTVLAAAAPALVWEHYLQNDNATKEQILNAYNLYSTYIENDMTTSVGADPHVTTTITAVTDCPETHLTAARDAVASDYGWEIPADAKAYMITCNMELVGMEGTQSQEAQEYVAVKYDGKFYIFSTYSHQEQYYARYLANFVIEYIVAHMDSSGNSNSATPEKPENTQPEYSAIDANAAMNAVREMVALFYNCNGGNLDTALPAEVWDYLLAYSPYSRNDVLSAYYNLYVDFTNQQLTGWVGANPHVEATIGSAVWCPEEKLSLVRDDMSYEYGWQIPGDVKAYLLSVTLDLYGDTGMQSAGTGEMVALKYEGQWYVFALSEYDHGYSVDFIAKNLAEQVLRLLAEN